MFIETEVESLLLQTHGIPEVGLIQIFEALLEVLVNNHTSCGLRKRQLIRDLLPTLFDHVKSEFAQLPDPEKSVGVDDLELLVSVPRTLDNIRLQNNWVFYGIFL